MENRLALITGGTSGIGRETARVLAAQGLTVVFTARDLHKGEQLRQALIRESGNTNIHTMYCRLDDLSSVRDFSRKFRVEFPKLEVLILNAGVWETRRRESVDGIEYSLAVNHLAPVLLTHSLLPLLQRTPGAHIINVTSQVALKKPIDFSDPEFRSSYPPQAAYRQSKRALLLYLGLLSEQRVCDRISLSHVHPGVVLTNIYRNLPAMLRFFFRFHMISPVRGAGPIVKRVMEPPETSGLYFHRYRTAGKALACAEPGEAKKVLELTNSYLEQFLSASFSID